MARSVSRLSSRTVAAKRTPGYFGDGAGLYLTAEEELTPTMTLKRKL
ncbi:MAG TPA: hypothetical protein VGT81_13270 [Casimicrobiaceae bacterium]|nr:hypothetical protein [Casimicrobiaceae bacterium]